MHHISADLALERSTHSSSFGTTSSISIAALPRPTRRQPTLRARLHVVGDRVMQTPTNSSQTDTDQSNRTLPESP